MLFKKTIVSLVVISLLFSASILPVSAATFNEYKEATTKVKVISPAVDIQSITAPEIFLVNQDNQININIVGTADCRVEFTACLKIGMYSYPLEVAGGGSAQKFIGFEWSEFAPGRFSLNVPKGTYDFMVISRLYPLKDLSLDKETSAELIISYKVVGPWKAVEETGKG